MYTQLDTQYKDKSLPTAFQQQIYRFVSLIQSCINFCTISVDWWLIVSLLQ